MKNQIDKVEMEKKYRLEEIRVIGSITLRRIRALESFGDVQKGELGGWIRSEKNLSQQGDCWVYGSAWVYGDARVYGSARVSGDARVYGSARVSGDARVGGDAVVSGNSSLSSSA